MDFHQPLKQEVIAHQHSLDRDQSYPHQKTCHELLQLADLSHLLQVKQMAIMTLDLSTSSSLSLPSSTSMFSSRHQIDHPPSSSRSSRSPIMTPSTVSSDSATRKARGDLWGIHPYAVTVSSKHVERWERGDLWSSGTPEEELLTNPTNQAKSTE